MTCPAHKMSIEELQALVWRLGTYRRYYESTIDVNASIKGVLRILEHKEAVEVRRDG